jgi:methylglutamate dehydrogenase subunit C
MSTTRNGSRLGDDAFHFRFDGREIAARIGDTAASALLASGVRLVARSVKYRRARGVFAAGFEEPNALVTVGEVSNIPATQLAVRRGLDVRSQNRWPSLRHDVHSVLQLGGGLFSAGFYYKTFIWPSWHPYEGLIRRLAGLGEAPRASDLKPFETEHLSPDVLVAGAGPAGLAAALAASRAGARVVVCEREPVCGGELEFEGGTIDERPAALWIADALRELQGRGVRVLTDTAVVGGSDGLVIAHRQRGGLPGADAVFRIRPRGFVMAMGAVERPIAFIDNDLPGVMLLGAAERYLARYGARVGENVVLFGNHDRLYAAATRLLAGGVRVVAVVDTRGRAPAISEELRRAGVECLASHAVLAAKGRLEVGAAIIAPLARPEATRTIACDSILVSGGWSPAVHPGLHEGGVSELAADGACFIAVSQPEWRAACGTAAGDFDLGVALSNAWSTGERAARAAGRTESPGSAPRGRGDASPALVPFWRSPARLADEKKQFVDLQNDVTVADLRQALAEGFVHIEHVKRYTTLGVGTEQGRTSSVLGAAILAELSGTKLTDVGVSRTRPPYQPLTMMALCGPRVGAGLRPERHTPLHEWHAGNGGVLEAAGLWMRPRFYRGNGNEPFDAGIVEATRVRAHGGISDGSTLGKIEVAGPEAAAFLDTVYLTRASTIKVGRSRYMVNLREDGMVLDDGIVMRLAEDRFLATISSGHAGHMLSHFEFWLATGPHRQAVALTDVTEAWAVIVVAGPQSRAALTGLFGPLTLSHMAFASLQWSGRELRILRASFSGELAFEVHCHPEQAPRLWQHLADSGLSPYGLEALDVLRVEKGYLVSSEINGQATPQDLGIAVTGSSVGTALLDRPAFADPRRPKLVGLQGESKFLAGAQVVSPSARSRIIGHVTSTVFSPHLNRWIGLGFVARDAAAPDAEVLALDPLRGLETVVKVMSPVHLDPAGERMKS